jgi:hypothetical protein
MSTRKKRDLSKYEKNPNVAKVTGSNILFSKEFKLRSIKAYKGGQSATDIFTEAGIDLSDFEKCYARKCLGRWEKLLVTYGAKSFSKERRGLGASGRPSSGVKFKSLEEEVAYLRAENDFLKKLRALGKVNTAKKSTK